MLNRVRSVLNIHRIERILERPIQWYTSNLWGAFKIAAFHVILLTLLHIYFAQYVNGYNTKNSYFVIESQVGQLIDTRSNNLFGYSDCRGQFGTFAPRE